MQILRPQHGAGGKALLQLPVFMNVAHKNILLVCGVQGEGYLASTLQARGATVKHLYVYERQIPNINPEKYIKYFANQQVSAIVAAAFTSIDNFKKIFNAYWQLLSAIPLVVVSKRIKILAQDLGFKHIVLSPMPHNDAIIKVLLAQRMIEPKL